MIKTLLVAARDRARLAEIVQVASRFGLGVVLARIVSRDAVWLAWELDQFAWFHGNSEWNFRNAVNLGWREEQPPLAGECRMLARNHPALNQ